MSYEIGYRRPPESGRFKKGKSGNAAGRPKGSNNFSSLLTKELSESISITENGKHKKITRMQAMVKRMVSGALQGDRKSLLTLIDVLKRTGRIDEAAQSGLLPDNYASLLDIYVQQRGKNPATLKEITPQDGKESP